MRRAELRCRTHFGDTLAVDGDGSAFENPALAVHGDDESVVEQ
jgi:hypothetical protein